MERISQRDLRSLLAHLPEIYANLDLESFASDIVKTLPKIFVSEVTCYIEVDLRNDKIVAIREPESDVVESLTPALERHFREHPPLRHYQQTRDGSPLKISDFLTQNRFHKLELYNEFYKELGFERELLTFLPIGPPILHAIALDRGGTRDFSERDRLLLDLLRPHLVQAYHNAESATRLRQDSACAGQTMEELDRGVICLAGRNRVQWCTKRARQLVSEYVESAPRPDYLPESLERWVDYQRSLLPGNGGVPPSREPLVLERTGKRLVVRLVTDRSEDRDLLFFEEQYTPFPAGVLEPLGLTNREAEVLLWTARGKSNKEVAATLYISPRTVKKHLEHIYQKLGVENRTEATARALEIFTFLRN